MIVNKDVVKRKTWVDCIRALAMVLVVFGHASYKLVSDRYLFFLFTSPIKMPLFFAISGYVFSQKNGNTVLFFKNWFRRLIIPWFCLALVLGIPRCFILKQSILDYIFDMISGKELWFMPCFAIAQVLHFFIRKYGRTVKNVIFLCMLCSVLGLLASQSHCLNFAMFNKALTVQCFYLIGFLFKSYEDSFTKLSWKIIVCLFLVYSGLCLFSMYVFPHRTIDVHVGRYYNIPLCMLLIYVGCFTIFIAAKKSLMNVPAFNYIGQNTLLLYIWHPYVFQPLIIIATCFHVTMTGWGVSFVKAVIAIVVCMICSKYVNKYIPFIVGK